MVSTSKILTVSYGTFSCTLEGFDDSFETMKAIAEYFRDLAADDRYFGAEPPTPDAEMLARIAEREIARRVEAHEDQGKIHLRAENADGALATTGLLAPQDDTPADDAVLEDAQAEGLAEESETAEPVEAAEPVTAPEPSPEPAADVEPEPVVQADPEVAVAEIEDDDGALDLAAEAEDESPLPEVAEAEPAEAEPADASPEPEQPEQPAAIDEETDEESVLELGGTEAEIQADYETTDDTPEVDPDIAAFMADAAAEEAETAAMEDLELQDEAAELSFEDFESADIIETSELKEESYEDEVTPEVDDIAEKLQRIRAVAAQSEPEFAEADFSEDEHAEDLMDDGSSELEALLSATRDEADAESTPQLDHAFETLEQAFADEEEIEAETAVEDAVEDAIASEAEAAELVEEDELAQLLADATPENFADDEAELLKAQDPVAAEVTDFEVADGVSDETADVSAEAEAEPLVLSNDDRVEIVEEPTDSTDDDDFLEDAFGESTLSPEDEADLLRELAEVEDEMGKASGSEDLDDLVSEQVTTDDVDLAEAKEVAQSALDMAEAKDEESHEADSLQGLLADSEEPKEKPRGLKRLLGMGKREPEEDVERLFDEADVQMEDEEATLRRNAIQHLRAAVAATRAERKAGGNIEKDVDDAPYRSDLAEVVRPRRPSASETENASRRPTRPQEISPAPLKLVAEQRVDMDRDPVRPRRVSAGERASLSEMPKDVSGGFAAYAEEMGASELPEILEAAAAYMSDIEGRAEFSRPMLMNKLKEVASENYSREDGLRSFGELLRGGKLRKIRGGRFSVTEETDFRSGEARNAG